mmetsp:Transcript_160251/g.514181  ORF Transcript_160251/g.514181 Transcript_160251/m.514181 type:complete len:222 (+) Transcript_160251:772-1437(+)
MGNTVASILTVSREHLARPARLLPKQLHMAQRQRLRGHLIGRQRLVRSLAVEVSALHVLTLNPFSVDPSLHARRADDVVQIGKLGLEVVVAQLFQLDRIGTLPLHLRNVSVASEKSVQCRHGFRAHLADRSLPRTLAEGRAVAEEEADLRRPGVGALRREDDRAFLDRHAHQRVVLHLGVPLRPLRILDKPKLCEEAIHRAIHRHLMVEAIVHHLQKSLCT